MFSKYWVFPLLFCVLSIFASSCKVDSLNDPIIIPLVDKEFSLQLWENLQYPSDPLEIQFQTISNENCLNAGILSSYQKDGLELNLTIFEILEPETCDPGMAPAQGSEFIHSLDNNTNYPIKIELQDIVINTGTLKITDTHYDIEMSEESGISWDRTRLYKVPQNSLWGFITYTNGHQLSSANDFITNLQTITTPSDHSTGYYGHFEINDGNIVSVKNAPQNMTSKLFIQYYEGSLDDITDMVLAFRTAASEGLELHLYDKQGNVW